MTDEPVTIVDRDVLKVLSVDTRMDILKELSQGSRTPSDLSKKFGKSSSTIVEHLETLVKAGLVKKIEQPGRKWIYYTLTERGEGIVSSKSGRLVIILGTSLLSIAAGFFSLSKYTNQYSVNQISKAADAVAQKAAEESQALTAPAIAQTIQGVTELTLSSVYLYVAIALFLLGLFGIMFYIIKQHKR
ncbi:MAG: winged helix-turn-helix domain-containing protein, partial [Nanoarchaeota archaeon]